jgi:hypothetical protein
MFRAFGPFAAQGDGKIFDGFVEGGVRVAAGEELDKVFTQGYVAIVAG